MTTYLFDPLCGWCYGAAPALAALRAANVSVDLAPTGLFAGTGARIMDRGFAAYAWENDQRIAQLTGQPFSEVYRTRVLEQPGGRFDSGPATRALTVVHLADPAAEPAVLARIQAARYVDGRDIADPAVLAEILADAGHPEAAARSLSPNPELDEAVTARVAAARRIMTRYGLRGVPALIADEGPVDSSLLFERPEALVASLSQT